MDAITDELPIAWLCRVSFWPCYSWEQTVAPIDFNRQGGGLALSLQYQTRTLWWCQKQLAVGIARENRSCAIHFELVLTKQIILPMVCQPLLSFLVRLWKYFFSMGLLPCQIHLHVDLTGGYSVNFKLWGVCPPRSLWLKLLLLAPPAVTRHGAHVQNPNETTWKKSTSTIILCTMSRLTITVHIGKMYMYNYPM